MVNVTLKFFSSVMFQERMEHAWLAPCSIPVLQALTTPVTHLVHKCADSWPLRSPNASQLSCSASQMEQFCPRGDGW